MPAWKRLAIISAAAGAGFALVLALTVGAVFWYRSRPKPTRPWNTRSIKAAFDYVEAVEDDGHLVFHYVLENTTDSDYKLEDSSTTTATLRLKQEQSLSEPFGNDIIHFGLPLFIPSGQRGRCLISLPAYKYPKGALSFDASSEQERANHRREVAAYVDEKLSDLDGFVLFDQEQRYEIDFPNGWTQPHSSNANLHKGDARHGCSDEPIQQATNQGGKITIEGGCTKPMVIRLPSGRVVTIP